LRNIREQLELIGFDETVRQAEVFAGSAREARAVQKRVEKTYELLTEEPSEEDMAFLHSGLCQTFLPHSKPANNHEVWKRSSGRFTLMVAPGILNRETPVLGGGKSRGESDYVGVPYGTKARLILIYLQSEGLKSRTVSLGESQSAFMRSLGLTVSGGVRGTINAVREQTIRLARCQFVLQYSQVNSDGSEHTQITDAKITDGLDFWTSSSGEWNGVIELNHAFWENLREHAVPLDKRGIAHLAGNSLALDLYTFFAYRLPRLKRDLFLTWKQLHGQVGTDMQLHRQLGARIRETLPEVLAAYPRANVSVVQGGLVLKQSLSAVPPNRQVRGFTTVQGRITDR